MKAYLALALAIIFEVVATSLLPHTKGFTHALYTTIMAICYVCAFYLLSIVVKTLPVGIAYAIWAGLGIVLVAAINFVVLKQKLDLPALLGIFLIIAGVMIINLFSKSVSH
ncbi:MULTISPECIES: DMT family transporter [unclassified Acinetobacter]|uniref:DMT family transporter n=1 Tax=unclassified Acinetobacter TaxID=196816 RepID=UPI0019093195|nr:MULTISPECIES: SMR family transporter [unclassified Acinetobacter]